MSPAVLPDRRGAAVSLLSLLAAVVWSVVLRAPLVINAPAHLDSDLAVDGLTLQEAVNGHWRWHYPGTPHMGTGAVLLSWIPAEIWGATPRTLVSGGTVAHVLLLAGVFILAWRAFGKLAAAASLIPLTFASTGVLWLSGRITGGHLLTVAWSAWAWLLFVAWVRKPGRYRSLALGAWCGLGLYLDSMFVMTLGGIGVAALFAARSAWRQMLAQGLILALAFVAGFAPRVIGQWAEPYDAYHEQFSWSLDRGIVADHSKILLLDCLPRLIAGHRLPGLEADPDPALLGTGGPVKRTTARGEPGAWWIWPFVSLAQGFFAVSFVALAGAVGKGADAAGRALAAGLLATAAGVTAGFVINRNIFNSDNYRYLVLMLVPWALGFGLVIRTALRRAGMARWFVLAGAIVLAALYTCDAAAWYRRLGWVDESLRPVRERVDDPALAWLREHPEVRAIFGGYWDVYRLSFLSGGTLRGVPFPIYPNRFPEWSAGLPGGRPETLLARRTPEGSHFLNQALREGGTVTNREAGMIIAYWPWPSSQ